MDTNSVLAWSRCGFHRILVAPFGSDARVYLSGEAKPFPGARMASCRPTVRRRVFELDCRGGRGRVRGRVLTKHSFFQGARGYDCSQHVGRPSMCDSAASTKHDVMHCMTFRFKHCEFRVSTAARRQIACMYACQVAHMHARACLCRPGRAHTCMRYRRPRRQGYACIMIHTSMHAAVLHATSACCRKLYGRTHIRVQHRPSSGAPRLHI